MQYDSYEQECGVQLISLDETVLHTYSLNPSSEGQETIPLYTYPEPYKIKLTDSYGDGWNGGNISGEQACKVYVNDQLKETISFQNGLSTQSMEEYLINEGDPIPVVGFYGTWRTYPEMLDYIDNLPSSLNIMKESIGTTYEGEEMWLYKRGVDENNPNKKIVFIIGTQHAREWISPMSCIYILENLSEDIINQYEFHIIPVVNVDGYKYTWSTNRFWRKNRHPNEGSTFIGTDLNRNWGYQWGQVNDGTSNDPASDVYFGSGPFSSPELANIRDLLLNNSSIYQNNFFLFIDIHSYTAGIGGIWGYTYEESDIESQQDIIIPQAVAAMNESTNLDPDYYTYFDQFNYLVSGDSGDWVHYQFNNWALFYELRPQTGSQVGFHPPVDTIILGCIEALSGTLKLVEETNGQNPLLVKNKKEIDLYRENKKLNEFNKIKRQRRCRCGEDIPSFKFKERKKIKECKKI